MQMFWSKFGRYLWYLVRKLLPFVAMYLLLELLEKSIILAIAGEVMDLSWLGIFRILIPFASEIWVSAAYWLLPLALFYLFVPERYLETAVDRWVTDAYFWFLTLVCLIEETAEILFWNEFSSCFNFVAVDYLIYTKEVLGNILQSYPMGLIIPAFILAMAGMYFAFRHWLHRSRQVPERVRWGRLAIVVGYVGGLVGCFWLFDISDAEKGNNRYNEEWSKDGFFALCSAFLKNEIDYKQMYCTLPDEENAQYLRAHYQKPNSRYLHAQGEDIAREVWFEAPQLDCNVMVIVEESFGSQFLTENRTDQALVTPCFDRLSREGIYFPLVYATGTRSVRGLEALSASIVPLPGMAIVRRDGNENLNIAGEIFRKCGYDTKWIYGGYGSFDNMNHYFGGNGFEVIDRTDIPRSEVTHSTIWGVCDENLFDKVLAEADKSAQANRKFFNFVFTTSNHRPYTYPANKIDIPSKTGRLGAVKYADFALGDFIERAKKHDWFDNTVFLIVADHDAGCAGKKELNPEAHQIPALIYAPKWISPRRIDYAISQIDLLPTLLGILRLPHVAVYYGEDALAPDYKSRYFINNYSYVGYGEDDILTILKFNRQVVYYRQDQLVKEPDAGLEKYRDRAIHYLQHATKWREYYRIDKEAAKEPKK